MTDARIVAELVAEVKRLGELADGYYRQSLEDNKLLSKLESQVAELRDLITLKVVDHCTELCPVGKQVSEYNFQHIAKLQAAEATIAELQAENAKHREHIDRMEPTICWGVECVHEAKALDMVYARQREVDELKATIAELQAENARLQAFNDRAAEMQQRYKGERDELRVRLKRALEFVRRVATDDELRGTLLESEARAVGWLCGLDATPAIASGRSWILPGEGGE